MADAGEKLVVVERFGQHVVGAKLARALQEVEIDDAGAARDDENRHGGRLPLDLEHRLDPLGLRHDDVGDHQIGPQLLEEAETPPAVSGVGYVVAGLLEDLADRFAHDLIVIDHENSCHVADSRSGSGTDSAGSGKRISKVVPSPGTLATVTRPPWLVTMPCTIDRPSPVPSLTGLVVKNGSKMRAMTAASMPYPVSLTARCR